MRRVYQCLPVYEFSTGSYSIVPIRDEDKYPIMQWRNEQIDVLRQRHFLTRENQETYFKNVVDKLFEKKQPDQLLFSFLENDILIGYGGLVHINWENKSAEISFLTETGRSLDKHQFVNDWNSYLKILKKVAELQLNLKKIYTYSYDIRPLLYQALNDSGFIEESRLKDKVYINNKQYTVRIHSLVFEDISFRMADVQDVDLYFKWANDVEVRRNSFHQGTIRYEDHSKWFFFKLKSEKCFFYLFMDEQKNAIGQVRIESNQHETTIGVSVDSGFRGRSLSGKMLKKATDNYLRKRPDGNIVAYIRYENISSLRSFVSAGFIQQEVLVHEGVKSYKFLKG